MSYQNDLILSIYNKGEPGLAMADPLPKGPDRDKPVQAPGKDGVPSSPYLPGKSPIPSKLASGYHTTSNGGLVDMSGRVFYNDNGTLRLDGDYDPDIHGELFPPIDEANRSMQINQDIARDFTYDAEPGGVVTPRYFTPPQLREYFRTPAIKEKELFHFNNFIRSLGPGLDTVRRRTPMSIG